jgi:hypothetical protein
LEMYRSNTSSEYNWVSEDTVSDSASAIRFEMNEL